jgi:TrfA protein
MTKQPLTRDLAEVMESLHRTLEAKAKKEKEAATPETPQNEPKPPAQIVHLPLWPEPTRGAPNDILRSALFAAIQGKGREFLKQRLIAAYDGIQIKYTGEQLEQSDLDVWEHVLHLARQHPLGTVCHFKGGAFLKAIGRSTGKKDYRWLDGVLSRLTACEVRIERRGFIHGRGLIIAHDTDTKTRLYKVSIDPDTATLYAAGWTAINWQQRQALRRKPLALWLHGYYATHAKPLPLKVDTLRSLSGSKTNALRKYRQQLRKALNELKAIGAIASWHIDAADLVIVDRGDAITKSQRRHLSHAKPRRKCKD